MTSNGYVWHEAVHWDALNRLWVFLPRRISVDGAPSQQEDEARGANWLLLADEHFENVTARRLGPLEVSQSVSQSVSQPASQLTRG